MDTGALHAFLFGFPEHRDQVGNVAVHIAVGQQADEVQRLAAGDHGADQVLPCFGSIDGAALNGFVDQLGALGINLAAAEGVVADFAVAHIVIGGKTDSRAVRLDDPERIVGFQLVQRRGRGLHDHVSQLFVCFTHTVHNNQNNGLFHKWSSSC